MHYDLQLRSEFNLFHKILNTSQQNKKRSANLYFNQAAGAQNA